MALDMYRQYIPELHLSIERFSNGVPQDGKYYVMRDGQVQGVFSNLKKAQELYYSIVKETGFKPKIKAASRKTATELNVDRYLDAKDLYWSESHRFRGGGGKGGRGGV